LINEWLNFNSKENTEIFYRMFTAKYDFQPGNCISSLLEVNSKTC